MQLLTPKHQSEIFRFSIGGGSAVAADSLVYAMLLAAGLDASYSKLISFSVGASIGFFINKRWTFESDGTLPGELSKYAFLYGCTAYLNVMVNDWCLDVQLKRWAAFLFATGASTIVNFLGQKFFVFHTLHR